MVFKKVLLMNTKKRVLIVDDGDIWQTATSTLGVSDEGGEVVVVKTAREASSYFNGKADAELLIVGKVEGVSDFVRDVRGRFGRLHIIGLAEHRQALTNLGCSCFVAHDALSHVVRSRLHY